MSNPFFQPGTETRGSIKVRMPARLYQYLNSTALSPYSSSRTMSPSQALGEAARKLPYSQATRQRVAREAAEWPLFGDFVCVAIRANKEVADTVLELAEDMDLPADRLVFGIIHYYCSIYPAHWLPPRRRRTRRVPARVAENVVCGPWIGTDCSPSTC